MSDIGKKIASYLPTIEQIADVALTVAKIMPATASIANAIEMGIKIEHGVRDEVPVILQTFNDMKALAEGGTKATPESWASWDTQIEEAHSGFLAAAAKVEAGA